MFDQAQGRQQYLNQHLLRQQMGQHHRLDHQEVAVMVQMLFVLHFL